MDLTNIPDIDEKELASLINEARKTEDYSSERLGELVSNLVKKILLKEQFVKYTEDWIAELFSEGCFVIFNAIINKNNITTDYFNYCYTCALNKMGKVAKKLFENIPAETITEIENDPFYVRNKRRIVKGFFDKRAEKDVIENASKKRRPLKNAVGLSARTFGENLGETELDNLINLAKQVRIG